MSYTPNVPQANQQIAATQAPILNNFTYINTAMRVNHTWNGNAINTEAAGSHQRLDFPNQGSDINTLPTGIAAVIYLKGGNLFSWNGAKRPLSGIMVTGSNTFNNTPVSLTTLPADCIGYVIFFESTVAGQQVGPVFTFMTISSVGTVTNVPPLSSFAIQCATTNLTATHSGGPITTTFKLIYWPI
jgi:hypothetical protein